MRSACIRWQILGVQVRFALKSSCQCTLVLYIVIAGIQKRGRRVLNPSVECIREQEPLAGWRPLAESLIWDHWCQLEKLSHLHDVRINK